MSKLITKIPCIFNDYEDSGFISSNYKNQSVGIVGVSSNCESNKIHEITKLNDSKKVFGDDSIIANLCEIALMNGAPKVVAISVDNSLSGYAYGFSMLEDISEVSVVVCDSENINVGLCLKNSVELSSQNNHERLGIVSGASASNKVEFATSFNCERIIVVAQNATNNANSCKLAAALAGIIAGNDRIIIPFKDLKIKGALPHFEDLSHNDINNYINAGITSFEYEKGQLKPVKVVTSKASCSDVNTILIKDYVVSTLRDYLKLIFKGEKNDSITKDALKTQVQIKLTDFIDNDIIDEFSIFEINTDVSNNICNVKIGFTPTTVVNQFNTTIDIRL